MDAIDRLIELSRLRGSLQKRCLLGGDWSLDHARMPDGEALFHVVVSGECVLRLRDGPETVLRAGHIAMLPRGDAHVLSVHRQVGADVHTSALTSHFNGAVTVSTNSQTNDPDIDLLCGRFDYSPNALLIAVLPDIVVAPFLSGSVGDLASIVGIMRREADQAGPGALSIVSALCTALFAMMLRAHVALQPASVDILTLLASPRIGASVIAMLERPAEKWTIELLAERSAMSRATYTRAFSALSVDSPMVLLARIRMQLAGMLLSRTLKPIAEIADDVGYQSESAFSKKFKDAFGVGPGLFRQTRV
ncbi:AraC family transcriptional regulator [Caballeronia sordidicola]|uniref:AraC family transcriptional regulator n=1 Tax=Caballeronia sordidicola TaxID=196367 RepID=UPI000A3B35B2|nr:AraC family transcriptional regulator [Caballeronia sordidicola]